VLSSRWHLLTPPVRPSKPSFFPRGGSSNTNTNTNTTSTLSTPCIGIDLGTTYSCCGVWRNDRVEICPNDQGSRITPSYVSFSHDGTRLTGDAAKNAAPSNPTNTVFDVKRLIGRKYKDPSVQSDKKLFPYEIVEDKDGKPSVKVMVGTEQKMMSPEEVSGMVRTRTPQGC